MVMLRLFSPQCIHSTQYLSLARAIALLLVLTVFLSCQFNDDIVMAHDHPDLSEIPAVGGCFDGNQKTDRMVCAYQVPPRSVLSLRH